MSDYRDTQYYKRTKNIKKEKQNFKMNHKVSDYYEFVKDKNKGKVEFLDLFDNKCVYCGNIVENVGIDNFEIDHFKNKASFKDVKEANAIENLESSCRFCNRKKSSFEIKEEYINILDPEENIQKVFFRDKDYRIQINNEFKDDEIIKKFYKKIEFDAELRRLDYLILEMNGLRNSYSDDNPAKECLGNILFELSQTRNTIIVS